MIRKLENDGKTLLFFYGKLEKEMSGSVKCSITFWVFNGITFFGLWEEIFKGKQEKDGEHLTRSPIFS